MRLGISGPAIASMFDSLAGLIYGAHSKGVMIEDRLIVHLNETITGADDDRLDHPTFLRHLVALPGDPYLVIEHLPSEAIPAARAYLLRVATSNGFHFTNQPIA